MLVDQEGYAFWNKKKMPREYELVVGYLYQLYLYHITESVKMCLALFYKMIYWSDDFDQVGLNWELETGLNIQTNGGLVSLVELRS